MLADDKIRIQHIIEEAQEACGFVKDISFADFLQDGKTVRAVIRSIEIIGEAASKISNKLKSSHKEIPWEKIIGMRNRLIHVYFDINYEIVWKTIKKDIPLLIQMIEPLSKGK